MTDDIEQTKDREYVEEGLTGEERQRFWQLLRPVHKEILIAANKANGYIHTHDVDNQPGPIVTIGDTQYVGKDPYVRAHYEEALEQLREWDLVVYRGGVLYCLTALGFRLARELSAASK